MRLKRSSGLPLSDSAITNTDSVYTRASRSFGCAQERIGNPARNLRRGPKRSDMVAGTLEVELETYLVVLAERESLERMLDFLRILIGILSDGNVELCWHNSDADRKCA